MIINNKFNYICDIKPLRNQEGSIQSFFPQNRYQNHKGLPLNTFGKGPFCKFQISTDHHASGVYVLVIKEKVQYVGECRNLSSRFNAGYGNISPKNCFKGGQETNCRINNLIFTTTSANEDIGLWFHQTPYHKRIEQEIRFSLNHPWNRV